MCVCVNIYVYAQYAENKLTDIVEVKKFFTVQLYCLFGTCEYIRECKSPHVSSFLVFDTVTPCLYCKRVTCCDKLPLIYIKSVHLNVFHILALYAYNTIKKKAVTVICGCLFINSYLIDLIDYCDTGSINCLRNVGYVSFHIISL